MAVVIINKCMLKA